MKIQPHKSGLVFASMFGGWHLFWSCLVALGVAQPIINFIFMIHMIHMPITVGPFDIILATTLVVVTSLIGYVLGSIAGEVWNRIHG